MTNDQIKLATESELIIRRDILLRSMRESAALSANRELEFAIIHSELKIRELEAGYR